MNAIDTTGWGEFKVVELFERIERGKGSGAGSLLDGDVPYVAASFAGNGYVRGVEDLDGSLTSDGNCIALICNGNGGIGRNTYQAEPFVGSSDLQLAYHPRLNAWNGLFLVACLDKSIDRYDYSFAWKRTGEAFESETVILPMTKAGDPDWDFMEQTMRDVMLQQERELDALQRAADAPPRIIDTGTWADFRVGCLFEIKPTKAYKAVNAQLFASDGCNPVVVNSSLNNGVGGYTNRPTTESGGIITFSDTTSSEAIFYQPLDFVGYPHVQGMYPTGEYADEWSELRLLFFLSTFRRAAILQGFDYKHKFTRDLASSLVVRLPVTAVGDPDWGHMERVMREFMAQREAALDGLLALAAAA